MLPDEAANGANPPALLAGLFLSIFFGKMRDFFILTVKSYRYILEITNKINKSSTKVDFKEWSQREYASGNS